MGRGRNMKLNMLRLDEFCDSVRDGTHDTPQKVDNGYKLITAKHINNTGIDFSEAYFISEKDYNHINERSKVEKWDVLMSMIGNGLGKTYLVSNNPDYAIKNLALFKIGEEYKAKWLHYYLSSSIGQNLIYSKLQGTGQPFVSLSFLRKMKIPVPDSYCILCKITSILSAYDNLIENNTRRIRLLEQMAENLYKEWFAYHKIKDDAKEVRITDFVNISRGLSYSSEEIECEEGRDLINLKNIQAFGGFRLDGTKKYNGKYKKEQIVVEGDLVMGVTDMTQDRRTVGSVALIPNISTQSVISADLIKLTSYIDNVYLYAMFRWGNVSKYISQFANGANVLHLRPQALKNIKVLLPPKVEIDRYVANVKPMIQMINKLNTENENLSRQRDLLLPRLMSGKLEVNV